jgi:hypothetical protein
MASGIQLLLLKNTAVSPQEYNCCSSRIQQLLLKNAAAPLSRISRLRDRGNIDLLLSTMLGIRIRPIFLRTGLFCWFKHISLRPNNPGSVLGFKQNAFSFFAKKISVRIVIFAKKF